MAEFAAGVGVALAAEQVLSTTAYAGAAGYTVAKPTMPLKATYTMIAHATDDSSKRSLARRNHTLTVIANKAYIFGGDVKSSEDPSDSWKVASNDMHVVTLLPSGEPESDYQLVPAIPCVEGGKVPVARTLHSACAFNGRVAIYGGIDQDKKTADQDASVWLFDPENSTWTQVIATDSESKFDAEGKDITVDNKVAPDAVPNSRSNAKLFAHESNLILYSSIDTTVTPASDVWQFDMDAKSWTRISDAPVTTSNAAFVEGCLYLIASSDPLSSQLHYLNIVSSMDAKWETITFPTNPMAPGPRPREHGGLLPITTGFGRNFLVYFFGSRETPSSHDESEGVTQWSDMWTLQIPSSNLSAQPKMSLGEAIKPAKIKDAIRSALPGAESGVYTWAEVEVQVPPVEQLNDQGKLHPGPRSSFGCDVMENGRSVVLWGGHDAKGERVGDGWIVKLE